MTMTGSAGANAAAAARRAPSMCRDLSARRWVARGRRGAGRRRRRARRPVVLERLDEPHGRKAGLRERDVVDAASEAVAPEHETHAVLAGNLLDTPCQLARGGFDAVGPSLAEDARTAVLRSVRR